MENVLPPTHMSIRTLTHDASERAHFREAESVHLHQRAPAGAVGGAL